MKKKQDNKKKFNLGSLAAELLEGFWEIVIELLFVGLSVLAAAVLPDSLNERIPDWLIYIAGLLFALSGIAVIHLFGASRKTRKNENKYGKIDPEHLKRRFDLLLGLGFTKEIEEKRWTLSVTYTYESERFICFVLDKGRIDCLLGIVGEKPESLTASGVTDVSGDPTSFDREYGEASNMRRLTMINELIETDSELMNFLTV